jgi:hypothetical protein
MFDLSSRELWTVIHGLVLGTVFLLLFGGGLAGLWSLRAGFLTSAGIQERVRRLTIGLWLMAATAWATVITGTWIVYPWYREVLSEEGADEFAGCVGALVPNATCSPRDFLRSNVSGETESWHGFGMEWKEHIAWAAPFLATAVAFIVAYYGARLIKRPWLRAATIIMLVGAFAAAAIGGFYGAFLNKIAPIV